MSIWGLSRSFRGRQILWHSSLSGRTRHDAGMSACHPTQEVHPPSGEIKPAINSLVFVVCYHCLLPEMVVSLSRAWKHACCFHNITPAWTPDSEVEKWKWKEAFYRRVPKIASVSAHARRWNRVHLGWQILLMFWLCFLFIIDVHQPSRPSPHSGADICLPGFLSLSLKCVMNGSVSCLIGDNSRNCNLRILPDCHISIWYYLYCIRAYYFLLLPMCLFTIDFSSSLTVATFAFLKYELDQEAVNSLLYLNGLILIWRFLGFDTCICDAMLMQCVGGRNVTIKPCKWKNCNWKSYFLTL